MERTAAHEVVVAGAGIIGIACAHYLQRAGHRVTVIDRAALAQGCSHGNCGYICPSHVLPLTEPGAVQMALKSLFRPRDPFRVRPRLNGAFWMWMWQFARRCHTQQMLTAGSQLQAILNSSLREYRQLMQTENLACEWQENGLLYVLQTERGVQSFAHTDHILSSHFGVSSRQMNGAELAEFEPALKTGLAGAWHYPLDASVRPDRLNSAWIVRLKERGVVFRENCELQGVISQHDQVTGVRTSQGEIAADRLVVAAGALSAQLGRMLRCRIPIEPGKGYSVTMERPEICPRYPMLFPEHRVGVSPFADGYRLGSMMEFSGFDTTIPLHRIEQLRKSAAPYLKTPVGAGTPTTWYGWRPMTWDSLPIIGSIPRLNGAYLATGHNMLGMSLATATGRLIAELIDGRTPHLDPGPYSPARF